MNKELGNQPQQIKSSEQHKPQQEVGNGAPGIQPTLNERANPPPESREHPTLPQKSVLNLAVEKTRNLYERNGWPFLPWGEAGKISPLQGEQAPHDEESRGAELTNEEIRQANEEFFEKLRRINPKAREQAQKRLLGYLFRRPPQDPEQEK